MAQWFGESPVTREVRVRCPMVAGPMITIHRFLMMNMIINQVNMRANLFLILNLQKIAGTRAGYNALMNLETGKSNMIKKKNLQYSFAK